MSWRTSWRPQLAQGRLPGLPSVDQIRSIRAGLAWYPSRRRAALMVDVGRHHNTIRLASAMTRLRWVVDWAPRPLPARLTDLVALCNRLVPVVAESVAITSLPRPSNASRSQQLAMSESGTRRDPMPVPSEQPVPRPAPRRTGDLVRRHCMPHRRQQTHLDAGQSPLRCARSAAIGTRAWTSAFPLQPQNWICGRVNCTTASTRTQQRLLTNVRGSSASETTIASSAASRSARERALPPGPGTPKWRPAGPRLRHRHPGAVRSRPSQNPLDEVSDMPKPACSIGDLDTRKECRRALA